MSGLFEQYTRELTSADFERLFTRDTPDAYRFFTRGIDFDALATLPWYRRWPRLIKLVFLAFAMRLSPARRAVLAIGVAAALIGLFELFNGMHVATALVGPFQIGVFMPGLEDGGGWLFAGFLLVGLLLVMEVADRLSLKNELEIAREIQLAMLPSGTWSDGRAAASGVTRPANTVGGDFYDILEVPGGRLLIAVGDVAGKGSPAALLMALLLSMLRTLADEGLAPAALAARLNTQLARHSRSSRFITLFLGAYDPATGQLEWVSAGHPPPIVARHDGTHDRLDGNSMALGLFADATFTSHIAELAPDDAVVVFSDGITDAEDAAGRPFDDDGLAAVIRRESTRDPAALGAAVLSAVQHHADQARLLDDLTVLTLRRLPAA